MLCEAPWKDQAKLIFKLSHLRQRRELCDVTIESNDGSAVHAHRIILVAASEPLAALLNGSFAEGRQCTVRLDTTGQALENMISYIYGERFTIQTDDGLDVLKLAHMYGIPGLESEVAASLTSALNDDIALRILVECEVLGIGALESKCEAHVVSNFETCWKHAYFMNLSATMLGCILGHPRLEVSREELALQALLAWGNCRENAVHVPLLLQHIRFPLLAEASLIAVHKYAESLGPCGLSMQREVRRAMCVHRHGMLSLDERALKRRRLTNWWPGLGASCQGGCLVARYSQSDVRSRFRIYGESLFLANCNEHENGNYSVLKLACGSTQGVVVAGHGAPVNGPNDLSMYFAFDICQDTGELIIADCENDRILGIRDFVSKVIFEDSEFDCPVAVCRARGGATYIVDGQGGQGTRVRMFADGVSQEVAVSSGGGNDLSYFQCCLGGVRVNSSGDIFILDTLRHRVLKWVKHARQGVVVAGGNDEGNGLHQLASPLGMYVDEKSNIYIADTDNDRVVKWAPGSSAGVIMAGGCSGSVEDACCTVGPGDVAVDDDGALLVMCDGKNDHIQITRWGPSPAFSLE